MLYHRQNQAPTVRNPESIVRPDVPVFNGIPSVTIALLQPAGAANDWMQWADHDCIGQTYRLEQAAKPVSTR